MTADKDSPSKLRLQNLMAEQAEEAMKDIERTHNAMRQITAITVDVWPGDVLPHSVNTRVELQMLGHLGVPCQEKISARSEKGRYTKDHVRLAVRALLKEHDKSKVKNAQRDPRAIAARRHKVDRLMAWHLREGNDPQIRAECLVAMNDVSRMRRPLYVPTLYNATTDETFPWMTNLMSIHDGPLLMRHLLYQAFETDVNWGEGFLSVKDGLIPETVANNLVGRPFSTIVGHPSLDGLIIDEIVHEGGWIQFKPPAGSLVDLNDIVPVEELPPVVDLDGRTHHRIHA